MFNLSRTHGFVLLMDTLSSPCESQDWLGNGLTLQCCWHLTTVFQASSSESPDPVRNEFLAHCVS